MDITVFPNFETNCSELSIHSWYNNAKREGGGGGFLFVSYCYLYNPASAYFVKVSSFSSELASALLCTLLRFSFHGNFLMHLINARLLYFIVTFCVKKHNIQKKILFHFSFPFCCSQMLAGRPMTGAVVSGMPGPLAVLHAYICQSQQIMLQVDCSFLFSGAVKCL